MVTKAQILEAIRLLPDDATPLDALEQLFILRCAERGVDAAVAWKEIDNPHLWCRFADRYEPRLPSHDEVGQ
jgi:hypothetical protein